MRLQTSRIAWVRYGLLAALIVAGGAGGYYLSGGWTVAVGPPTNANPETIAIDQPSRSHRFSLSSLDAKDTVEAPDLALDPSGRVFLTWASRTDKAEKTILLTRSTDAGQSFDAPRVISKGGVYRTGSRSGGTGGGYERRATPHVAWAGDKLHLTWSEALPDGSGMRMVRATSTDGGITFDKPHSVHRGERAKPTFTAMTIAPNGALACAWLDDRSGVQQPFAAVCPAGADSFVPELVVSRGQEGKGVCPCCPTAACFGPDGCLFVAFRNIKNGFRDIAVGRLRRGQSKFDGPFAVVPDTWKFEGCPHDGPSITIVGEMLHVLWMDARNGQRRCYHAQAKLADMVFKVRDLHSAGKGDQGNPKLIADASDVLHAVWEESLGTEPPAVEGHAHQHGAPKVGAGTCRAILYAVLRPGQEGFGPARPLAAKTGAFQSRPAIAVGAKGELFAAWNELDESGKAVVVTRVSLDRESSGEDRR